MQNCLSFLTGICYNVEWWQYQRIWRGIWYQTTICRSYIT